MVKSLLLDVDGVIANGEIFSQQLAKDYNISPETVTPFFKGEFQKCVVGEKDLKEAVGPYLKEWGWEKSTEDLLDYWFKAEHKIDEPLIEYVKSLQKRGIKCYLATNQEKYRAEYMLAKMGFKDIFDGFFFSSLIGHKKPNKEFFDHILEKLAPIKANEILFWDNTLTHIEGARVTGLQAEQYTTFDAFVKKMEDYLD